MRKFIWWFVLISSTVNIILVPIGGAINFAAAVIGLVACAITGSQVFNPIKYVFCARCKDRFPKSKSAFTAGYYDCSGDSYWAKFVNPGEDIVCDECIWATESYQKIYGDAALNRKRMKEEKI
jgi:hypothetical protein